MADSQREELTPYVIGIAKGRRPDAMLIGRVKGRRIEYRAGYLRRSSVPTRIIMVLWENTADSRQGRASLALRLVFPKPNLKLADARPFFFHKSRYKVQGLTASDCLYSNWTSSQYH
jgi:hypothetical protein